MIIPQRIHDFIDIIKVLIDRKKLDTSGKEKSSPEIQLYLPILIRTITISVLTVAFAGFSLYTLFCSSMPTSAQEKAAYFLLGALITYWFAPDVKKK
jgi:uncharacterized membrane protein